MHHAYFPAKHRLLEEAKRVGHVIAEKVRQLGGEYVPRSKVPERTLQQAQTYKWQTRLSQTYQQLSQTERTPLKPRVELNAGIWAELEAENPQEQPPVTVCF